MLLNAGFPNNSLIHSTGFCLHSSSFSAAIKMPSSLVWLPFEVIISQVHLVPWAGSTSIVLKKTWLFSKVTFVQFLICDILRNMHFRLKKKHTIGNFKNMSVCFWPRLSTNHSANSHSSSSLKGSHREPACSCFKWRDSKMGIPSPHVAPARLSGSNYSIYWPNCSFSSHFSLVKISLEDWGWGFALAAYVGSP